MNACKASPNPCKLKFLPLRDFPPIWNGDGSASMAFLSSCLRKHLDSFVQTPGHFEKYCLVCDAAASSSGWGHDATLLNGYVGEGSPTGGPHKGWWAALHPLYYSFMGMCVASGAACTFKGDGTRLLLSSISRGENKRQTCLSVTVCYAWKREGGS